MSDLHLEFYFDHGTRFLKTLVVAAPNLFLAGDIHVLRDTDRLTTMFDILCAKWERVFYVPGNHEYYDSEYKQVNQRLRAVEKVYKNLTVLRKGTVHECDGARILGDTMWFPFKAYGATLQNAMSDFGLIRGLTPAVYKQNSDWLTFLEDNLKPGDVVMTHHMPLNACIAPAFKDSPLNPFFVCNCRYIIEERKPAIWLHGHGHSQLDFKWGSTRILANPRGYPGSKNIQAWDPIKIFEVP